MSGNNGLWIALPQQNGEQDGEIKYFDQMYLTPPEAEHVRRLALLDLQAQGHIEAPGAKNSQRHSESVQPIEHLKARMLVTITPLPGKKMIYHFERGGKDDYTC